jgi:hypothetical protein
MYRCRPGPFGRDHLVFVQLERITQERSSSGSSSINSRRMGACSRLRLLATVSRLAALGNDRRMVVPRPSSLSISSSPQWR